MEGPRSVPRRRRPRLPRTRPHRCPCGRPFGSIFKTRGGSIGWRQKRARNETIPTRLCFDTTCESKHTLTKCAKPLLLSGGVQHEYKRLRTSENQASLRYAYLRGWRGTERRTEERLSQRSANVGAYTRVLRLGHTCNDHLFCVLAFWYFQEPIQQINKSTPPLIGFGPTYLTLGLLVVFFLPHREK